MQLWYPARGDLHAVKIAKSICAACPVRSDCLSDALASEAGTGELFGIRAGFPPRQRAQLLRARDPRKGDNGHHEH